MIDFSFENIKGFKKSEITDVIKKSVKTGIDEINFQKKYYLSIFITDNKKMKIINFTYRKKNKTTNVLSFPQNDFSEIKESSKNLVLGDIVVSLEKVYEESIEQKKDFHSHLSHMIIHSLLHLFGFDHKNEKKFKIMKEKEISILSKMDISSPY
tara:strand:+ start:50 stop:511 length:462 start_codon:yes stop_codon:yes gene_type:complete